MDRTSSFCLICMQRLDLFEDDPLVCPSCSSQLPGSRRLAETSGISFRRDALPGPEVFLG